MVAGKEPIIVDGVFSDGNWTHGVVVYHSNVSANRQTQNATERLFVLFLAHNIPYTPVDITMNAAAKEYMQKNSDHPLQRTLPQVFNNGKYLADWEEMKEINEDIERDGPGLSPGLPGTNKGSLFALMQKKAGANVVAIA